MYERIREMHLTEGHFSLRIPNFPDLLTQSHEKMTLLSDETPVSVSDWRESAVCWPGKGGLQHYSSGGIGRGRGKNPS